MSPTIIGVVGAVKATVKEFGDNANFEAEKLPLSTKPLDAETLV